MFTSPRNHSKKFPKYSQASFRVIVNLCSNLFLREVLLPRMNALLVLQNTTVKKLVSLNLSVAMDQDVVILAFIARVE